MKISSDIEKLEQKSAEISRVLKTIGNERRLVILCQLAAHDEMSVSSLVEALNIGQSALSQHLAKMREEEILKTRRDGQSIFYSIADERVSELMRTFHKLYCADDEG